MGDTVGGRSSFGRGRKRKRQVSWAAAELLEEVSVVVDVQGARDGSKSRNRIYFTAPKARALMLPSARAGRADIAAVAQGVPCSGFWALDVLASGCFFLWILGVILVVVRSIDNLYEYCPYHIVKLIPHGPPTTAVTCFDSERSANELGARGVCAVCVKFQTHSRGSGDSPSRCVPTLLMHCC